MAATPVGERGGEKMLTRDDGCHHRVSSIAQEGQVGPWKVFPFTEQRQATDLGKSIRATVPDVQCGRMVTFAEALPGPMRRVYLINIQWNYFQSKGHKEGIEDRLSRCSLS